MQFTLTLSLYHSLETIPCATRRVLIQMLPLFLSFVITMCYSKSEKKQDTKVGYSSAPKKLPKARGGAGVQNRNVG